MKGDIAAAYSADMIGMKNQVRSPFRFQGGLWVCTSIGTHCEAYRLVPLEQFDEVARLYREKSRNGDAARNDPNGFYHGMKVQHRRQWFVLQGPPHSPSPGNATRCADGTVPLTSRFQITASSLLPCRTSG